MMGDVDTGIMTRVLNTLLEVLSGGADAMGTEAIGLLSTLIAIEIVWAGCMWALGSGSNFFKQYLKKVMKIGIFAFFTLNFATIANVIMDGFVWAGTEIGGGSIAITTVRDPSAIIEMGFSATGEVWKDMAMGGALGAGFISDLLIAFVGLGIMILYFLVALQVFMTLVEFYLIISFGVIMVPWGVNKHTSFIAEKYFGAILAQGVKLMVVVALLAILLPLIEQLYLGPHPTFTEVMSLAFGMGTIGFLIWRAPNVASGLMSGSANLQANDAVGMGMGAAMAGKTAAVGAAGGAASVATGGAAAPAAVAATGGAASGAKGAVDAVKGSSGGTGADGKG